jgi:hypothetical protein
LIVALSPHTLLLNPDGNPDLNWLVVSPLMPESFAMLPAPWLCDVIPLVFVSQ